jgi:hypothetical protein
VGHSTTGRHLRNINGINPAAVGDFSFIDSRNRSPVSFEAYYYEGGFES